MTDHTKQTFKIELDLTLDEIKNLVWAVEQGDEGPTGFTCPSESRLKLMGKLYEAVDEIEKNFKVEIYD